MIVSITVLKAYVVVYRLLACCLSELLSYSFDNILLSISWQHANALLCHEMKYSVILSIKIAGILTVTNNLNSSLR